MRVCWVSRKCRLTLGLDLRHGPGHWDSLYFVGPDMGINFITYFHKQFQATQLSSRVNIVFFDLNLYKLSSLFDSQKNSPCT